MSNDFNISLYISLGEALGVFGIVFAIYQIKKPEWDILLNIRHPVERYAVWWSGIIGFILVMASCICHYNQQDTAFIWLQFLGLFFLIGSPGALIYYGAKDRKIFNKDTAKDFFEVLYSVISRSTNTTLDACINVLFYNLPEITNYAKKSENLEGNPILVEEKCAEYARAVLEVVLSEPKVATYITTSRLDFLVSFFEEVKSKKLTQKSIGHTIEKIINSLFNNPSSFLYTHFELSGLSLIIDLNKHIFHDLHILSNFRPLGYWYSYDRDIDSGYFNQKRLTVYLNSFSNAIQAYWNDHENRKNLSHEDRVNPRYLWDGFNSLNSYVTNCVFEINGSNKEEQRKLCFTLLGDIARFVGREIPKFYKNAFEQSLLEDTDINPPYKPREYSPGFSINYAEFVKEFLEELSLIKNKDLLVRHIALDATNEIFDSYENEKEENIFAGIREYIIKIIWEKINDNINGFYPPLLRVYLAIFYLDRGNTQKWFTEERNKLISLLYNDLKPKIENKEIMADCELFEKELLPSYIEFNTQQKIFEYITPYKKERHPLVVKNLELESSV